MIMEKVLIVGYGEIGQSIESLYSIYDYDTYIIEKDTTEEEFLELSNNVYYAMHVCFPSEENNDDFVNDVATYIDLFRPKVTIIHSTVPVGTTRDIYFTCVLNFDYNPLIAHSPVIGVHPNLLESLQTFDKTVGAIDEHSLSVAASHLLDVGMMVVEFNSPEETELAKLMSTTYYGLNIRFMQAVHDQCEKLGLDFENVYTQWNENYNAGYEIMGMEHVMRPVLKYMGDEIGGHCIIPNSQILASSNKTSLQTKAIALDVRDGYKAFEDYVGELDALQVD